MKIGKIIKELRIKSKITQAELAKRTGLDFTTISKLEKGSLTGTLTTHQKIAKAFGITLSELCKGLDEPQHAPVEINQKKTPGAEVFYYNDRAISQILVKQLSQHKMAPELLRLEKGGLTHLEQKPKGTEQFIFVLEGKIEITVAEATYGLEKGENIIFNASLPYKVKNVSNKTTKCLRITSPVSL